MSIRELETLCLDYVLMKYETAIDYEASNCQQALKLSHIEIFVLGHFASRRASLGSFSRYKSSLQNAALNQREPNHEW
jgi:hypothetical protein